MRPRNYIGLACSPHDPALAVVDSRGEVVFAEATERYLQCKRAMACVPDDVFRIERLVETWCEPGADLVAALTWTRKGERTFRLLTGLFDRPPLFGRRARGVPARFAPAPVPRAGFSVLRWLITAHLAALGQGASGLRLGMHWQAVRAAVDARRAAAAAGAPPTNGRILPIRQLYRTSYSHHLTHAAAGCYSSPFEDAVCAIVDGFGEGSSCAFFAYRDGRLEPIEPRQKSHMSLGGLYAFLCLACGFDPLCGEEWKVMGLAPYGAVDRAIYGKLADQLAVEDLRFMWRGFRRRGELLAELSRFPREDVARTGQEFFLHSMEKLLANLARRGISRNLVLGGGCALNSSANGELLERTPFERLHVYCAPGDDGNAVGAALLAWRDDHPDRTAVPKASSPYLGSPMSGEALGHLLQLGRPAGHSSWPGKVHEKAARLLAEGKILGWVQGRAEFGPRALGNRSILADPRRAEVKDVLNERVKFREEFRPFAPSILHEHGPEYFEEYQESPYMERTLRFRDSVRDKVPGVVHVDGTGRLQSVKREWNERYYDLIFEFHKLTGVPVVLNTSFNVMGKPIIHSVEDALAVFYTSGLDALVIHDEVIEK